MHDQTNGQPQKAVELAHFLTVTACQIVIDRNHMNAFARQGIEVYRQRCHERLAFTGTHFGNAALMQAHTADELHVKMAHAQRAARSLTYNGKRLRQQVVKRFARCQPFLKLICITRQLVICQILHLRFEGIDFFDNLAITGNLFIVIVA